MVKCDELGREPYESERVRIEEIEDFMNYGYRVYCNRYNENIEMDVVYKHGCFTDRFIWGECDGNCRHLKVEGEW